MGRPSKYSKALVDKICIEISTTNKGLAKICEGNDMPTYKTVFNWLGDDKYKEFLQSYTRAREAQADFLADECIDIADTPQEGVKTKTDEHGKVSIEEGDMLGHRKLQIDARKWKAAKLAPKKYGDRVQQDVTIDDKTITPEEREARIAVLNKRANDDK